MKMAIHWLGLAAVVIVSHALLRAAVGCIYTHWLQCVSQHWVMDHPSSSFVYRGRESLFCSTFSRPYEQRQLLEQMCMYTSKLCTCTCIMYEDSRSTCVISHELEKESICSAGEGGREGYHWQ